MTRRTIKNPSRVALVSTPTATGFRARIRPKDNEKSSFALRILGGRIREEVTGLSKTTMLRPKYNKSTLINSFGLKGERKR